MIRAAASTRTSVLAERESEISMSSVMPRVDEANLRTQTPVIRRVVAIITRSVYVLSGVFYLLTSVVVLLLGTGLLPAWVHDRIFEFGQNNPLTMHLIQETATLWVLVGLLLVWFARHYDQSIKFHWAMTFYLSLNAFVHWFSAYGKFENEPRVIVNAIPFILFLVLGLLRRVAPDSERHSGGGYEEAAS